VAPGERITLCLKIEDEESPCWGGDGRHEHGGHATGAVYPSAGTPRVVKEVLCSTATDLGRERSFPGHGLLGILRACQKR